MVLPQRLIIQLLIAGSQVVGKAFVNAWRQAAAKSVEMTPGRMTIEEAKNILGLQPTTAPTKEIVQQRFDQLFKANDPNKPTGGGSLYLQGKILGAKRILDEIAKSGKS